MRLAILFSFVFSVVIFSASADAAPKLTESQSTVPANLIEESNSLKIQTEDTVQVEHESSERIYGLRYGVVQGGIIQVPSNAETLSYDVGGARSELGARFGIYPFKGFVDLGVESNVGYFSVENLGSPTIAVDRAVLHVVGLEALLSAKKALSFASWLSPQIGVGGGVKGLFQRGYTNENTSIAQGFGVAQLGLNINMSHFRFARSSVDWGIFLDGRQYFGPKNELNLTNFTSYSAGLNLAL